MFKPANAFELGCGQEQRIVLWFPVVVGMQSAAFEEGDEGFEAGFAVVTKSWNGSVFVLRAVSDFVEKCG